MRPKKKDSKKEIELIDGIIDSYTEMFKSNEDDEEEKAISEDRQSAPDKEIGMDGEEEKEKDD